MKMNSRVVGLVTTILASVAPTTVFSATDIVDVCQVDEAPDSLPHDTLKVVSLNISHGRNTAINQIFVSKKRTYQNLDNIAVLLGGIAPDVVALQEADAPSRWSGNFDHVAYVAKEAGYPCRVHGRHSQSWISDYGTALLSRSKPADSASVRFSPSWPSKQKGYVSATFDWLVGQERLSITIVSVHFDFLRKSTRDRQVRKMVEDLSNIKGPLILMGDLNSEWEDGKSHVRMLADELSVRPFYPERGGLGTYKGPTGKRLDWILITRELEFKDHRVLPDIVADHFAVFAEISYGRQHE